VFQTCYVSAKTRTPRPSQHVTAEAFCCGRNKTVLELLYFSFFQFYFNCADTSIIIARLQCGSPRGKD